LSFSRVPDRLRGPSFFHLLDLFRLVNLLEVKVPFLLRHAELQLHALLSQRLLVLDLFRQVIPLELWEVFHVPQVGEVRALVDVLPPAFR
jgi:hypothetical protein